MRSSQLRLTKTWAATVSGSSAVQSFQKRHRLTVTGKVTSPTWRALGVPYVKPTTPPTTNTSAKPGTRLFGKRIMAIALPQAGKPYRRGGNGPSSFDCSGLVKYVYARVGHGNLPRTSAAMATATRRIPASQRAVGDLVFVRNGGGGKVGHVAIYAGNGYWFEATRPGKPVAKNKAWSSSVFYGRVR